MKTPSLTKAASLVLAGSLMASVAIAQTTTASPARPGAAPVVTTPGATLPAAPGTNTATGAPAEAGIVDRNTGTAAASGNRNQAVVTTGANAPQPARGANSFSGGEARRRLENAGFATVANLRKDNDGVWRASAMKGGSKVGVWLDYKGNTGEQ